MTAATIILLVLLAPLLAGILALVFFGAKKKRTMPVGLLLHAISEKSAPHCSYYSPKKFTALLDRLAGNGFILVTLGEALRRPDPDRPKAAVMCFDDGFESFYRFALPQLQNRNWKATVFPVAGFLGKPSTWDTLPPQIHLTKEQVKEILSLGHEIGSHTMTHPNLTLLSDADLSAELSQSKKILEDITGRPVTSLSFPFGQWNRRVWNKALEAGYTAATSYAGSAKRGKGMFPLWGIYSFDSVQDVWDRAIDQPAVSNAVAQGIVMPHFAKGTPMWKFRKGYGLLR
ncbi:MAG TPA: polysaccharide deacetylase family protein [Chitinivibrionales bacterium]|nr:polysaccharide deacetylase family protein [Chitinivibrionales bacterium]